MGEHDLKKKIMSIALGSMILASQVALAEGNFNDIDNHWASKDIEKLSSEKVISGYFDETFKPNNYVTREEAAKMVGAYFGNLIKESGELKEFGDVNADSWSVPYINRLVQAEIISGYPDGTFKPGDKIKRAEFASMIYKALDNTGKTQKGTKKVKFTDIKNSWAEDMILNIAKQGAISGYPDGTFLPENYITRAEVSSLLNKLKIDYSERAQSKGPYTLESEENKTVGIDIGSNIPKELIKQSVTVKDASGKAVYDKDVFIKEIDKIPVDEDGIITEEGSYKLECYIKNEKGKVDKSVTITLNVEPLGTNKPVSVENKEEHYIFDKENGILYAYYGPEKDLTFPSYIDGVEVKEIAANAFNNRNSALNSIRIPVSITTIGEGAFGSVAEAEEGVNLNKPISSVEFYYTKGTASNLTTIGAYAFNKSDITTISIPQSVNSIGNYAFSGTANLKEVIFSDDSNIEIISEGLFSGSSITDIKLPSSVETIKEFAFTSTGLTSINIPSKVTSIEKGAFMSSKSLSTLEFNSDSKLNDIYFGAFLDCGLNEVKIPKSLKILYMLRDDNYYPVSVEQVNLDFLKGKAFDGGVDISWLE